MTETFGVLLFPETFGQFLFGDRYSNGRGPQKPSLRNALTGNRLERRGGPAYCSRRHLWPSIRLPSLSALLGLNCFVLRDNVNFGGVQLGPLSVLRRKLHPETFRVLCLENVRLEWGMAKRVKGGPSSGSPM